MSEATTARISRPVLALAAGLCAFAAPAGAQLPPSARDVELRVGDFQGGPIQEGRVQVLGAVPGAERLRLLAGQERRPLRPKDFADDRARLADLPDGQLVLLVEADGHALALSDGFELPAKKPVRLDVRLARGVSLRGTVTSPDGAPVAGAVVRTLARDDDNQHPFARTVTQMFVVPVTAATARTADDGTFRIDHVAPGDYVVRASHGDWADARREVRAKAKGEQKLGKLVLQPGVVVAGAVQRDGKRVADAVVVCLRSPEEPVQGQLPFQEVRLEVRTDAEGAFVLPRVAPGSYRLLAHQGGDPIEQARQMGASGRTIEVLPQPDGKPQHELLLLAK